MLKKEIFGIGALLMLLATGCKKSNSVNTIALIQFPNEIGDKWQYLVKDTTFVPGSVIDTSSVQYNVDVLIINKTKLPDGITVALWQFKYPDHVDSNFVYQ